MGSPQPLHSFPAPPAMKALTASDHGGNPPSRSLSSVLAMRVVGMRQEV